MRLYNRLYFITAILLTYTVSFAQSEIPIMHMDLTVRIDGLMHEGSFKNLVTWKDQAGEHIVGLSETGIHHSKKFKHESDGADAELFAYHYLVTPEGPKLAWKIYDYINDCPVDIEASFVSPPVVTDLNKDGIAEIWVIYKTVCHGDVSPLNLKIIMYESSKKFAMRGETKVQLGEGKTEGGNYSFDKAFTDGPKEFRTYAKTLWDTYVVQ